ncbi:MAG: radical SAM protein [Bacteroidota bacterium]
MTMRDIKIKSITNKISNNPPDKGSNGRHDTIDDQLFIAYNQTRPFGPQPTLCYAPFKNIYFGRDGKAAACCYNRYHILGSYPDQSIKEIWFGEMAEKLREHIKNNVLSLGCVSCKEHLTAKNFDGVRAMMYDRHPSNENNYPSVIELELSNTCNLECEMCFGEFSSLIRKNREKKQPVISPYNAGFIRQLEEFMPYLHEIKFYGGEPFLVNRYYDIWERIIKINPCIKINVSTNATILNQRVKDILSKAKFDISISIDSLQRATYEKIRIRAKYDRVMKNITYFRDYCRQKDTFFGISVCPMRQNWHELPDFINYCNQLEAPVYFNTVWYPSHCSLWNLDPISLKAIVDYLSGFEFPVETIVQQQNQRHYFNMLNLLRSWYKDALIHKNKKPALESSINSIGARNAIFKEIKDHVFSMNNLSVEEKENKINDYISKINYVLHNLPEDYPADKVMEYLLLETHIERLIRYLEENDRESWLDQAKNFAIDSIK